MSKGRSLVYLFSLVFTFFHISCARAQVQPLETHEPQLLPAGALPWINYYAQELPLTDVSSKLVDNQGNGREDLYGVRNFRVVLRGILYRGGANNYYHKEQRRENQNPLPNDGLTHLCEKGFGLSIYLYPVNYKTAPHEVHCSSPRSKSQTLTYIQKSPLASEKRAREILELIHRNIQTYEYGPIYTHCWNGWHASGYISTLALMQFCGWNQEEGIAYWNKNTDGHNVGKAYDAIRDSIRNFVPDPKMIPDTETQQRICLPKTQLLGE